MMRDLMPKCQFLKRNISCWVGKIEGNPCGPLVSTGRLLKGKSQKRMCNGQEFLSIKHPQKTVFGGVRGTSLP